MPDESTRNPLMRRRVYNENNAAGPSRYRNPFLLNQNPEGPTRPPRPPVAPNVDEGRYFDPNLSEGARLSEDNQPCLICTGKINNKGEYQKDVRPRQCFTCNKLFHYTCLGDWFIKCPNEESTCPACRSKWKYTADVAYLKKNATEREEDRRRIEAIERETRQTTNQLPTNFGDVAVTRPQGRLARLCRFMTPRRRRVAPTTGGKRRRRKKTRKKRRKTKRKKRRRKKKKKSRRRRK